MDGRDGYFLSITTNETIAPDLKFGASLPMILIGGKTGLLNLYWKTARRKG